jgi:hypothetical protein
MTCQPYQRRGGSAATLDSNAGVALAGAAPAEGAAAAGLAAPEGALEPAAVAELVPEGALALEGAGALEPEGAGCASALAARPTRLTPASARTNDTRRSERAITRLPIALATSIS